MISEKLRSSIRTIEDFPRKGISFKDLTPVFKQPDLCLQIIDEIINQLGEEKIDAVIGVESRGFFLGPSLAFRLGVTFVPVRKKGKLPFSTHGQTYDLEYGTDTLEMHTDALQPGDRVLVHDDVLATGGTAKATGQLVGKAGAEVAAYVFLIELAALQGRNKIENSRIITLATYN